MQNAAEQQVARKLFVSGLENIHAVQRDAKSMMLQVIDRLERYLALEAAGAKAAH